MTAKRTIPIGLLLLVLTSQLGYAQYKTESRFGVNYGIEVYEYSVEYNNRCIDKIPNSLDTPQMIVPVLDVFYNSYNGPLLIGGAAGVRLGGMKGNVKLHQASCDVFVGFGSLYFDLYLGVRGRIWYELSQKAFVMVDAIRISDDAQYVPMDDNLISFSYGPLAGLRIYLLHSLTFTVEVTYNFYTVKTTQWDARRVMFPFSSIIFAPIGIKASIGLSLPDWLMDYY